MAKLTESATYSPTIFRLETTTPVAGGAVVLDGNDDPVQGHANAQAQLLANRTKYLKEITDTLGTASTANVTTSSTDTTANRVLKVGDFGIGTDSQPTTIDPNTVRYGSVMGSVGQANAPTTECIIWSGGRSAGARAAQFAIDHGSPSRAFIRGYNAGRVGTEWAPWSELFTTTGTNVITSENGSFGYGTGSGGTVTQATSKSTAVTLNKPSGRIITASDSLAPGAFATFALNNNKFAITDCLIVNTVGNASYRTEVAFINPGVAGIRVTNISGTTLAEALLINFTIIKGAIV